MIFSLPFKSTEAQAEEPKKKTGLKLLAWPPMVRANGKGGRKDRVRKMF